VSAPSISSATEAMLLERAWQVFENAYAPYSEFGVGAALLTADGAVFIGCNVECAAYPHGICAERTAVSSAVAAGKRDFVAIAIATRAAKPTPPCGGCRQFMAEFSPDLIVIYATPDGVARSTVAELLPEMFTPDHLD